MRRRATSFGLTAGSLLALLPSFASAADPQAGPPLTIRRVTGEIRIDGELDDPGWAGVEGITRWYETNVGDSVEPAVRNVAYLAYDDQYFYAAFDFEDPQPAAIRAPLGDRDALPGSTDYAGVIVDSRNDGKTAQLFLANLHGTLYDAVTSDASGEDSSPDFYWEALGKTTERGWTLELRIPFSSLRYEQTEQPTWGILLYRNHPRDRRLQYFTARMPRDVNCFICNSSKLVGLESLPRGSKLVVAPYATASRVESPAAGPGSALDAQATDGEFGLDVKWNPSAAFVLDGTLNPDFSQVESDTAQITANERFALFFPEKRPFFLESVDLFATPIAAVYTRSITSPSGGVRTTGRAGATSYTALVAEDRGGGLVILPGPQGSGFAPQNFESWVGVARVKHDLGSSFVGFLATDREWEGGGYNRVLGPDFQWRPKPSESITGQLLFSESRTPTRPDLAGEWDGRQLRDPAWKVSWSHSSQREDWYVQLADVGGEFRADDGFVPQVGYREAYVDGGYTFRPQERFLSRLRLFTVDFVDVDEQGATLSRRYSLGAGMDGRWNSFVRVELNQDSIRVGPQLLDRFRPYFYVQASPGRLVNLFYVEAFVGDEIDFANAREGTGATVPGGLTLRPGDHLELRLTGSRRWLDVDSGALAGRLFTAEVARLRAQWSFNARSFLRLIGQYIDTVRDPSLYTIPVVRKEAALEGSALFAYKVNWQTVLYVGFGDFREYDEPTDELQPASRQLFVKASYAWQP